MEINSKFYTIIIVISIQQLNACLRVRMNGNNPFEFILRVTFSHLLTQPVHLNSDQFHNTQQTLTFSNTVSFFLLILSL